VEWLGFKPVKETAASEYWSPSSSKESSKSTPPASKHPKIQDIGSTHRTLTGSAQEAATEIDTFAN